jgi:hypothetical protein
VTRWDRSDPAAVNHADRAEASSIALDRWYRHQWGCGACATVPEGGRFCERGLRLLWAHEAAVEEEIRATREAGLDREVER